MPCSLAHSLAVVLLGPQKWRRQGVRPGHFDFESDLGLQLGPTNGTRESLAIEEPFKRSSGPLQKLQSSHFQKPRVGHLSFWGSGRPRGPRGPPETIAKGGGFAPHFLECSHASMLCERGPIPLLPKRAPMRSWTATLESSDRYRGPVDDRGTNFHQLASRTRAHPLTTMWLPSGSPGPRAGACLGQITERKTVTCKKMLCNLTD